MVKCDCAAKSLRLTVERQYRGYMIANDPKQTAGPERAGHRDDRRASARTGGSLNGDRRRHAYWTALGLASLCLLEVMPALWHLRLATAPGWARALLLGSLWQLAFVAWMATIPDRGSVWVLMFVFAIAATLYAAVASILLLTPDDFDLPLGLTQARWPAFWWSILTAVLSAAAAFWCGSLAQRWRKCDHGQVVSGER